MAFWELYGDILILYEDFKSSYNTQNTLSHEYFLRTIKDFWVQYLWGLTLSNDFGHWAPQRLGYKWTAKMVVRSDRLIGNDDDCDVDGNGDGDGEHQ